MTGKLLAFVLGVFVAAAGPSAFANCQLAKVAELPVVMAGLRPLVTAKVNGKEGLFLVDSGAFYSMLSPEGARKFGLRTYPAPPGFYIQGVGGAQGTEVTNVAEFTYAGIPLKNFEFLVSGRSYAPGSSGLIGQNILGTYLDIEYDLANGVIRLFRSKDCAGANLAYWSEGKPLSILTIDEQSPQEPHIIASAKVNGHPIRAMFDTGASTSVVSRLAAARAGVEPSSVGVAADGLSVGIGAKRVETSIASFASLAVGDEEIKNARLRIADTELPSADMVVGDDFFLSHRVMVARTQRRLYFTYNGGPVFRLERASTEVADAHPDAASPSPAISSADGPKTADEFSRRGAASAARREFPAAIADFTRAIEIQPLEARHYRDRAHARWAAHQAALALADYNLALKFKPDDQQSLVERGELHLSLKSLPEAQADFDAAVKLSPKDADLPLRIAEAYAEARVFDVAVRQFSAWIEVHPDSKDLPLAFAGRCEARAMWGREMQPALADCDQALQGRLRDSPTMRSRALVLLRLGRDQDAVKQFDAALRAQPKDPWSLFGRGLAKLKIGATAAGQADIKAATALQPDIAKEAKSFGFAPEGAAGTPAAAAAAP